MPLNAGDKLGHYVVVGPLGAGGMGEVYRARDPQLERDVAIKVLPLELANDPERLTRFDREAKILAALNHPQYRRHLRTYRIKRTACAGDGTDPRRNARQSHEARSDAAR